MSQTLMVDLLETAHMLVATYYFIIMPKLADSANSIGEFSEFDSLLFNYKPRNSSSKFAEFSK